MTVKLNAVPAETLLGALMLKWFAAAGLTVTLPLVPVRELFAVSVAVMV